MTRRLLVLALPVVAVGTAAALLVGTGRGAGPEPAGLPEALLLPAAGDGWQPGPAAVNGALSPAEAAASTVLSSGALAALLRNHGFEAGASRVWVRGDDFVSAVVLRLEDQPGAQAVVDAALAKVARTPGGLRVTVPGVDGAEGFFVPSWRDDQPASVFCGGAWVVRGPLAAQVLECTSAPVSPADVFRLAAAQAARLPA